MPLISREDLEAVPGMRRRGDWGRSLVSGGPYDTTAAISAPAP